MRLLHAAAAFFATMCTFAGAASLDYVADAVLGKRDFASAAGGTLGAATLASPRWAAVDSATGQLWVSDAGAHRVMRFASVERFLDGESAQLVLGQAAFTDAAPNRGSSPTAATLNDPAGVLVDEGGNLYVADSGNHRVLIYRPPFSSGMDAAAVIGQPNLTSNLSNNGPSGLSTPMGLSLDLGGNLLIADYHNARAVRFILPYNPAQSPTGSFSARGAGVAASRTVSDVAVDSSGKIWIVEEANHRAIRLDVSSEILGTRVDAVLCQPDFASTAPGTAADRCSGPTGIALDFEGGVYVADRLNNRVVHFPTAQNGTSATGLAGQIVFTAGACNQGASPGATTLCLPTSAMIDRTGNLIVSDSGNGRVLRFDLPRPRTAPMPASLSPSALPRGFGGLTLTVNGDGFYAGSTVTFNGQARPTTYVSGRRLTAAISSLDVASGGPFVVAVDNPAPGGGSVAAPSLSTYAVTRYDGVADRILGQRGFTSLGGDVGGARVGSLNAAALVSPNEPLVGNGGRLFVSDFSASRVLSWASVDSFQNAQPADLIIGQPDEFSTLCNGGLTQPTAATLCLPDGLAMDPAGALYVADRNNHRLLVYEPPFSNGMAASRVFGQSGSFTTNFANKGGVRSADTLWLPRGVLFANGTLFVQDGNNRRILGYRAPSSSTRADFAIGQPDPYSYVTALPSARRFTPGARLAMDSAGRLYASFDAESRILRFSPPFADDMAADLVIGQKDFDSYGAGPPVATSVNTPFGLSIDATDRLYVADVANNRILQYRPPFSTGMAASAVLGQADFTSSSSGRTASKFLRPFGVAVYNQGDVLVTDLENRRLLQFAEPFRLPPADIFTSARLFVMQQYRDFLGREGESGGVDFWTSQIDAGRPRAYVIESFFNSAEFQGTIAPVARLYFAYFLRVPDYDGMNFWIGAYRAGNALEAISNSFASSAEFASRYGSLDNAGFVNLVYRNLLGRAPDAGGVSIWLGQLDSGMSRGQMMMQFSESLEYRRLLDHQVYVTMAYFGMLRRAPEPEGFAFWVDYLNRGQSKMALINNFLSSAEYTQRFLP